MEKIKKLSKYSFVIGAIFVLTLFGYMTIKSPLAGDDWGYCVLGKNQGIIRSVIDFYFTWSGRVFSELWDFTMAVYKNLWNVINPIIFLVIYLCLYFLGNIKTKKTSSVLLIIAMMLSVFYQIRTQTYTWITGGIYSVSLCLSLLYFLTIDIIVTKNKSPLFKKILFIISNVFLLMIGLMVENIALTMIVGIIILIIYSYITNNKKYIKYLMINLLISVASFCAMRLSPGSTYRFLRDHPDWVNNSIIDKITNGYKYFLEFAFIKNTYTIVIFSFVMISLVSFSGKKNKLINIISVIVMSFGALVVISPSLLTSCDFLYTGKSLFSMLFWPVYVIFAFFVLIYYLPKGFDKDRCIFYLLFGGISASAMIMSPINGARTYIYLVYYLILICVIIINSFETNKYYNVIFSVMLLFVVCTKTKYYIDLYRRVSIAQQERLEIIKYYQEHPEDEEAWIKRFPENALHSVDIEDGDDYHFEVFKEYYNLPQEANNIVFYFDK